MSLQLDVLPGIRVAGGNGRKHVLPLRCGDLRADRVDEGVTEDRNEIVVLENLALDLLGELLALGAVDRVHVGLELGIERGDADAVLDVEAAALEPSLIPVRPAAAD